MAVSSDDININTIIGPGSAVYGDLRVAGFVRIDGDIDGDLDISGRVIIGEHARIRGNILTLKPVQGKTGRIKVTLQANSNGKLAQTDFYVNTSGLSGMKKQIMNAIRIVSKKGELTIEEIPNKSTVQIFNAIGVLLKSYNGISGRLSVSLPSNQMYVLKIGKERYKVIL